MARENLDPSLTTEDIGPGSIQPQPQRDSSVDAIEDGGREQPARQQPQPERRQPTNQDKPTLTMKSPQDARRDAITKAANERRRESDQDVPEESRIDMERAQLGDMVDNIRQKRDGRPLHAEDAIGQIDERQASQRAPINDPNYDGRTAESHGNAQVEIIVNRKPLRTNYSALRDVLAESGVDPKGLSDDVVRRSAQAMLAAQDRLQAAKRGREVDEPEPQHEEPAPQRWDPRAAMTAAAEEIQIGDPAKGAEMLLEAMARVAQGVSTNVIGNREQTRELTRGEMEVDEVAASYAEDPAYQQVQNHVGPSRLQSMIGNEGVEILIGELSKYAPEDRVRLLDAGGRGRLYRELRSQGLAILSEGEIIRRAHDATISLFGAKREAPRQTTQEQQRPSVRLSREREIRRESVSQQPRASGAVPQPQAAPKTRSDVVQDMRRSRGQKIYG